MWLIVCSLLWCRLDVGNDVVMGWYLLWCRGAVDKDVVMAWHLQWCSSAVAIGKNVVMMCFSILSSGAAVLLVGMWSMVCSLLWCRGAVGKDVIMVWYLLCSTLAVSKYVVMGCSGSVR